MTQQELTLCSKMNEEIEKLTGKSVDEYWKERLIFKISQMTKQDLSFYSKNNIEELEKKFWELKYNQ